MSYVQQTQGPTKHLVGIGVVIVFHVILVYALVNGLGTKIVEVIQGPLEARIVEEAPPPPPPSPPPPPLPKFTPPPTFIPPPEVNIAADPTPPPNPISVATSTPVPIDVPPAAPRAQEPTPPPQKAAVRVAPVVRGKSCAEPEYPAASARLGESGKVVLALLVGVDGRVVESKVEQTSGFPRLDEAARAALSLCKFTPGTVDSKPTQAWGRLAYVFRNPDS
jgi:periplasmic protein TonB